MPEIQTKPEHLTIKSTRKAKRMLKLIAGITGEHQWEIQERLFFQEVKSLKANKLKIF